MNTVADRAAVRVYVSYRRANPGPICANRHVGGRVVGLVRMATADVSSAFESVCLYQMLRCQYHGGNPISLYTTPHGP